MPSANSVRALRAAHKMLLLPCITKYYHCWYYDTREFTLACHLHIQRVHYGNSLRYCYKLLSPSMDTVVITRCPCASCSSSSSIITITIIIFCCCCCTIVISFNCCCSALLLLFTFQKLLYHHSSSSHSSIDTNHHDCMSAVSCL
jgi:hypothetical protein